MASDTAWHTIATTTATTVSTICLIVTAIFLIFDF
jgi:hypothetical protein